MELFIKVAFGYMIINILLRGTCIALSDYPRETPQKVDVISLLTDIPILVWLAILVWS